MENLNPKDCNPIYIEKDISLDKDLIKKTKSEVLENRQKRLFDAE